MQTEPKRPRSMKQEAIIKFFKHIVTQHSSHGIKDAFQFKAILTSHKKGDLDSPHYIDPATAPARMAVKPALASDPTPDEALDLALASDPAPDQAFGRGPALNPPPIMDSHRYSELRLLYRMNQGFWQEAKLDQR